ALFYGVATVIGSVFPCDAGCSRELSAPSSSYVIHLVAGVSTHVLVPPSLLMIGIAARKWENGRLVAFASIAAGTLCLGCNQLLSADPLSVYAGLFQRIFEGSILCWIVLVSFFLQRSVAAHVRQDIDARPLQGP